MHFSSLPVRASVVLLGLFPFAGRAQATRTVTTKREQPEYFTESYSVLVADGRTRHGAYAKNGLLNRAVVRGYYRNGQKDSVWTFYYAPSGQVQSRGRYRAGQKTGVWEYWHYNGQLYHRYNHSTQTLLSPAASRPDSTVTVAGPGGRRVPPERSPLFEGGDEASWLGARPLQFPMKALKLLQSGTVRVDFVVAADGKARDFRVIDSVSPTLDAEALRMVRNAFSGFWLPALFQGRPVEAVYRYPVTFRIN